MKVRFYLKRATAKKDTAIFAVANYAGHSLKIYTGEAINPKFWNSKTQTAKTSPSFPESPEFNQRLVNIRATINRVYLRYVNDNDNQHPEPQQLRELIENAVKGKGKQTFLSYFDDFVNRTLNGQRLDPKSRKPIRHAVGKGYQTTLNHLKGFAEQWHRELSFTSIDLEFHKDFTAYLAAPPRRLSANTIGSNFQRIKAVLGEATEKGLNINMTYKSRYFVKQTEEASTIYLNLVELNEIEQLNFSNQPRLDKTGKKWYIVLGGGNIVNYWCDIWPAMETGEVVVEGINDGKENEKDEKPDGQPASVADELAKLKKLYDDGVLTKEEFEAQKKKLLEQ